MLPLFASVSARLARTIHEELDKFVEDHAADRVYSADGDLEQFSMGAERIAKYWQLERRRDDAGIFSFLLPRMTVVSLISLYDAYLARVLRTVFEMRPEILNGSERQLKFADLVTFDSIHSARACIADLEVEAILRQSHTEQFEWLEKTLAIPLRKNLPAWAAFVELTERRNLFVHLDGVVNSQYLRVCGKADVVLDDGCVVGTRLHVAPEYFLSACRCVLEIGLKLNQVIWRKMLPGETEEADKSLIGVSYELLLVREFRLVEELLDFATRPPFKHASKENELYLKINLAIALKAQNKGEGDSYIKVLEDIDFSALSDLFRLANAALREDVASAVEIMRRMGPEAEKPNRLEYRTWPLFRWLRKSTEFQKAFEDIFGEPLGIVRPTKSTGGASQASEAGTGDSSKESTSTATINSADSDGVGTDSSGLPHAAPTGSCSSVA